MWYAAIPLLACMAFYCLYLLRNAFYWQRLINKKTNKSTAKPGVSVIVPFRNEEKGLQRLLPALLNQDYPAGKIQIICVDDHSEDDSVKICRNLLANFSGAMFLLQEENKKGKKAAIEAGVASASGEIILTTDADCLPGPGWISAMVNYFTPETGMVSGPVQLEGKSVFEKMQALEFMGLNAVGAASVQAGTPNMCNGANLAYRKAAFESVRGFEGFGHLPSGDDEFLMHKLAASGKWKIEYAADTAAIVRTPAQPTLGAFARQRKRWVSKSTQYSKFSITLILILSWLGIAGIPVLAIFACFQPVFLLPLAGALFAKILAEGWLLMRASAFFNNFRLLIFLLPEQLLHILYILWVGLAANLSGYEWKGRRWNPGGNA